MSSSAAIGIVPRVLQTNPSHLLVDYGCGLTLIGHIAQKGQQVRATWFAHARL